MDLIFVVFCLKQSATLAGGLFIAKQGVSLFTEEIVPVFKGFANEEYDIVEKAVELILLMNQLQFLVQHVNIV